MDNALDLVKLAMEQVSFSKQPYTYEIAKLDFEKLATALQMSTEDCKVHLKNLMKPIQKMKYVHYCYEFF